jgi:hypothetical protein
MYKGNGRIEAVLIGVVVGLALTVLSNLGIW